MIKIRISGVEASLQGRVWSCEDKEIEKILNYETAHRPFGNGPRIERGIADYIVATFAESGEPEIISDSEEGKPKRPRTPGIIY